MEVFGDRSASAGAGSKRIDDDPAREEQEQPEEKSLVPQQRFAKMHRGQATDFPEDVSNATTALAKDGSNARSEAFLSGFA